MELAVRSGRGLHFDEQLFSIIVDRFYVKIGSRIFLGHPYNTIFLISGFAYAFLFEHIHDLFHPYDRTPCLALRFGSPATISLRLPRSPLKEPGE